MKDKDSPLNIFQSASQKKKPPPPTAKPPPSKGPPKEAPKVAPPPPARNLIRVPIPALNDPEIKEMLKRIDEMRKEIEDKVESISRQSGWSKEKIWGFVNNPKNFTPQQWEIVKKETERFVNRVWAAVSPGILKPRPKTETTTTTARRETPKERKAKFIGSRRHWIPTK